MPKIICKGAQNKGFKGADAVVITGMQIGGKKMPRYIDAELLIDKLEEKMRTAEEPYQLTDGEKNFNFGLELATEIAFNMPTADVVEVVRCNDCIFSKRDMDVHPDPKILNKDRWCELYGMKPPDWFCADGERRDDE